MAGIRRNLTLFLCAAALLSICFCLFHRRQQENHPTQSPEQTAGRSRTIAAGIKPAQPASAQLSLLTEVSFPADSPVSSHPVERAVSAGNVLDVRLNRLANGRIQRTRLLKSEIMPRLLRVEEEWALEAAGHGFTCLKREMFLADQLILRTRPQVRQNDLKATLAGLGMDFEAFLAPGLCTVRLREAGLEAVPRALAALAASADIFEHAEADGVGFGGAIPNDPNFASQWGVHNTGQSGGAVDADVDGPEIWDILGTAPGIVIAVLDSGLNFTHPDLQGIGWTNLAEIPGDALDNDGNGRIDDFRGWDFTNTDNDPTDDHGHGSNVTGIIAANRDNGVGIAGMVGGAKVLVCKILNANNAGATSSLIAATTYARLMGAPIMNMSLQNYPFSATLNTEFNACQSAGILLSICAGNQGVNNDLTPNYPSCYPHTNIIAVGNHDRADVRYSGSFNPSNYGPTNVDLFAPGREILSPVLGNSYASYTGTSQATPFVTATTAAIKYLNPGWTASQIKNSILRSVVTRPAYSGICTTGGRHNGLTSIAHAIRQLPENDADADSFSNLFEYLAGTRMDDTTHQPAVTYNLQGGYLHLKVPRVPRPDASLEVQQSTNLVRWSATGVTDFSTANLLDGGIPIAGGPLGFLRIRAVNTP